jgi:hypothetical protein
MQVSRRNSNAPGKNSLLPVTQVLDEGLASNLPAGALLSAGNPTSFHRGSFFLLPANGANRDPPDHPIAFFWARMGEEAHGLSKDSRNSHRRGTAMTDRSYEIPQDADFRNLARLVTACTLGLWAFGAGLLIGVFLFS